LGIADFAGNPRVFTPDDLMDGRWPEGRVVIYDDDYFYTASVAAEALRQRGCDVTWLTPDDTVASWSANTLDYRHIQWRMAELGVAQHVSHQIAGYTGTSLALEQVWSGAASSLEADAVVVVTARLPDDALYQALKARESEWSDAGVRSVSCIGDALAPGLIAHAVYAGHRYAQELDAPRDGDVPFKRHFHHDTPMA
jgi:dimethylamine/trimethylamine dehydrogenase